MNGKQRNDSEKRETSGATAREKPVEGLEPCDKAFNNETSRLESEDDACDDGVR